MENTLTIEETQAHYKQVQQNLRRNIAAEDDRKEVKQKLSALESDLSYIIGDRGFEEFVAERLTAYQKQVDDATALCSCWRSTCPLKQGDVPEGIRQHGTTLTGRRPPSELVAEWLQRHDGGEALALIRKEWAQMVVRVHAALTDAKDQLRESAQYPSEEEVARNVGVTLEHDGDDADGDDDTDTTDETADEPTADDGHTAAGVADD